MWNPKSSRKRYWEKKSSSLKNISKLGYGGMGHFTHPRWKRFTYLDTYIHDIHNIYDLLDLVDYCTVDLLFWSWFSLYIHLTACFSPFHFKTTHVLFSQLHGKSLHRLHHTLLQHLDHLHMTLVGSPHEGCKNMHEVDKREKKNDISEIGNY